VFQRRRARAVLAVFVFAALALVTIDFRTGDDGPLDRLRGGATAAFRPVQDGVTALVRPFGNAASSVTDWFSTRSENERLREQVAQLEERRRSVTDLERENEELRELLSIRDRLRLETVTARTVALGPSNFEWTMTIDAGANDGIERNMPVINGDGLVGRVIQVTPDAARVLLAIDPNFSAAARTARRGEIGAIDGRGGEPMLLRPLDPEADIELGDELVTSSYQGGVFPGGIPIGTVTDVGQAGARLRREVEVAPFVDFTRVHHVLVVLNSPVDELPEFRDHDGLDFTRPPVDPLIEPEDLDVPARDPDEDDDPDDGSEADGAEGGPDDGSEDDP
jgi:rod shape-determining protein MreC